MKISLAVLALLNIVSIKDGAQAINIQTVQQASAMTEETRYIGSNGQPINLAQTEGHLKLELTKVRKFNEPRPIDGVNVQLNEGCTSLPSPTGAQSTGQADADAGIDDVTHCPINKPGEKVKAHIVQNNLEDNAYVSDMYVGNPPQLVRALFDTGSTNTWVLSKTVDLGGAIKERSYDNTTSKTAAYTPQKAQIFFGSGNLGGHFITDDIRLGSCDGSKSSGQIHIKNQKFGNVEKQHTIFTGSNFEAIVGLAYPALAERGVTPVFDEMIQQQLLQSNVFSFYLTSVEDEKKYNVKSDLTFGYFDKTKFQGDIHWNDINFQYMFGVKLDDVKVNGKSLNICQNKANGCLITFDSGTSLMSVPTFAFHSMAAQKVPTAHTFVECQNKAQFGDFTLVIGGKDYDLTPDEWMFDPQQLNLAQGGQKVEFKMGPLGPQILAQVEPENVVNTQTEVDSEKIKFKSRKIGANGQVGDGPGKTVCASTIMKMDIKKEMFLVGDVFMRKFYTIFDRDNNRVGLAKAHTPQQQAALAQQSEFNSMAQKQSKK